MRAKRMFLAIATALLAVASSLSVMAQGTEPQVINRGTGECGCVALTFDLCPTTPNFLGNHKEIVRILKEKKVPITFFASGEWITNHPEEAKAIAEWPLFEIENHSETHPNPNGVPAEEWREQIRSANETIEKLTGRRPIYFRLPHGFETIGDESLKAKILKIITEEGMVAVEWSLVTSDPYDTPTMSITKAVESVKAGDIVIAHANGNAYHTHEALPEVLDIIQKKGLRLVTISQLLGGKPQISTTPTATPSVKTPVTTSTQPGPAKIFFSYGFWLVIAIVFWWLMRKGWWGWLLEAAALIAVLATNDALFLIFAKTGGIILVVRYLLPVVTALFFKRLGKIIQPLASLGAFGYAVTVGLVLGLVASHIPTKTTAAATGTVTSSYRATFVADVKALRIPEGYNADAMRVKAQACFEEHGNVDLWHVALSYNEWWTESRMLDCSEYKDQPGPNKCVSNAGAQGPDQFMPKTWPHYSEAEWSVWNFHDSSRAQHRMFAALNLFDQHASRKFATRFTGLDEGLCWNCIELEHKTQPEGDEAWEQAIAIYNGARELYLKLLELNNTKEPAPPESIQNAKQKLDTLLGTPYKEGGYQEAGKYGTWSGTNFVEDGVKGLNCGGLVLEAARAVCEKEIPFSAISKSSSTDASWLRYGLDEVACISNYLNGSVVTGTNWVEGSGFPISDWTKIGFKEGYLYLASLNKPNQEADRLHHHVVAILRYGNETWVYEATNFNGSGVQRISMAELQNKYQSLAVEDYRMFVVQIPLPTGG